MLNTFAEPYWVTVMPGAANWSAYRSTTPLSVSRSPLSTVAETLVSWMSVVRLVAVTTTSFSSVDCADADWAWASA